MNATATDYRVFPKLNKLEFSQQEPGYVVLCDPDRQQYFRVGEREAGFIRGLDGTRTLGQIQQDHQPAFHPNQAIQLIDWLADNELLAGSGRIAGPVSLKERVLNWLFRGRKPFRLHLASPDPLLRRLPLARLFDTKARIAYWLLALMPIICLLIEPGVAQRLANSVRHPLGAAQFLAIVAIILFTTVIHELAHAAACIHFGGRVNKIGIMIMYLMPAFYCDISASWSFRSKAERIIVASAGLIAHAVQAGMLFLLWVQTDMATFLFASLICYSLIMLNLLPFIKLDGYWILVHILGEPNLRARSISYLIGMVCSPRARREPGNVVFAYFGAALVLGSLGFFIMGLFSVHNLLGYLSKTLADGVAVVLCIIAAIRVSSYLFQELKEKKA